MYITGFEVEDLRCFAGHHEVSLDRGDGTFSGWTVFAGPNGSGKTTLLQVLAFSAILMEPGAASVWPDDARWVHREKPTARISARRAPFPTPVPYGFPFTIEAGRATWTSTKWSVDFDDPLQWGPTLAFASLRLLPDGVLAAEPARSRRIAAVEHLLNGGRTLTGGMGWLIDIHTRALEKREGFAELKQGVLDLLNDGLLPGARVVRIDADGLTLERDGMTLPVRRFGDGYRAVAHLVLSIVQHLHAHHGALTWTRHPDGRLACDQAAVVLIDEIDAHLHVSWQRKIGFWLTSRFPKIQFLVTTHSPFVCQAASPRGLIRLPAPGEDRRIAHVSDEVYRSVVYGTVDDAVLTELFGLDHARSDEAEARVDDPAVLEAKVLDGSASAAEIDAYRRLRDEIGDPLHAAVERAAEGGA